VGCLVDEYNRITSPTEISSEDVATAYALLVTITFWEYEKGLAAFDRFNLSRLEWGNEIKDIFRTNTPINTIVRMGAIANIPPVSLEALGSSTSRATYEYSHSNRKEGEK
jgi:hypothetical protein